jgi:glycine hydroxymethyltransferase
MIDKEVLAALTAEEERQQRTLCMIPSENIASPAVREACASVLMNKYSEGYAGKRYYQGNAPADAIEALAVQRAKTLFGAEHVNVQPYSGSPANQAVYLAFLKPGDTVLGLALDCGGHLTHGSPVNFSGRTYHCVTYGVHKETGRINMEEVRALAHKEKPKLIISGATAYSRTIDFKAFQEIAEEVGALHLADISHIAGLIVGGAHPSPFPFTDIVMTTTHKTLRGPRGAMLLCKEKYAKELDKAVFPGLQGGPHDNITAAKAVAFNEALQPAFKHYAHQVVKNAQALADTLQKQGITIVSGGTENHLLLIDLRPFGIGLGKQVAIALEKSGIICNMNTVPYDPSTPFKPSGLRLGTPALTTRGMKETHMHQIGAWIAAIIKDPENETLQQHTATAVANLCTQFPIS